MSISFHSASHELSSVQHIRYLTVGRRSRQSNPFPCIRLAGRWLWCAGFHPGQRIRVTVSQRGLLIQPVLQIERASVQLQAGRVPSHRAMKSRVPALRETVITSRSARHRLHAR